MSFNKFPWTNLHGFNLDWVIETVKAAIAELAEYELSIDTKLAAQDLKIAEYKQELEEIVEEYKTVIESEMEDNRELLNELYKRTLDVYNKTVLQVLKMEQYVDNAVANFGSIAQWSISDSGQLIATVFNNGILISIGMTEDGRLEVTTDV